VTIVTFFTPLPCNVTNDHLPRPNGSSPLVNSLDVQSLQRIVAVPPGWYWDKKSSGARDVAETEFVQV
jgi:hypothetical protein